MKTVVVIPTYNESENIERLIAEILNLYSECDVLVVDANSPDGTGKIVERLAQQSKKIRILHLLQKQGLGRAYIAGFQYILSQGQQYSRIIQMDADFSHQPQYLTHLLEATKGKDISIGSRYIPGGKIINWSLDRRILSYLANVYVRFWLSLGVRDSTSGFRCFRAGVFSKGQLDAIKSNGYLFQIEMLNSCIRLGCSVAEVPIVFYERKEGKSKLGFAQVWEAVWGISRIRLNNYFCPKNNRTGK